MRSTATGPICVVTSWTLGYLDLDQRADFLDALVAASGARTIAWVSLEHPGVVRGVDGPAAPTTPFSTVPSLVGLTVLQAKRVDAQRPLAHVHPHGSAWEWIG